MRPEASSEVVFVMAPLGADARNIRNVLDAAGIASKVCATRGALCAAGELDCCGALLLTEEAVTAEVSEFVQNSLRQQAAWSDLPLIIITSGAKAHSPAVAKLRRASNSIALLERPLRMATLVATVQTALVSRRRQFQVRDLLRERDDLLSSLETRVAVRTAELRNMVEEMEAFSYSVSHDLRSPLRSLAGFAEALQEDHARELSPAARSYLERIARAAERMDRLTQDLLAYTRVTRGEMEIAPVDLDTLVGDVIEEYPAIEAVSDRIVVQRPLGHVLGHAPSLVQCFSNLIGNAAKFGRADTPLRIEIRSQRRGERLRVFVQDNGVGIDGLDLQRIFRMFERAAPKDIPGTGIGLAIVKKAVDRMGGAVGVASHPGRGSEFWLELALAPTSPAETREGAGVPGQQTFAAAGAAGR